MQNGIVNNKHFKKYGHLIHKPSSQFYTNLVYNGTLRNQGFILADGESDLVIGRLGKEIKCLIISNDSDYLYGYGFDTVRYSKKMKAFEFFEISEILTRLEVTQNQLRISGVLTGSDYNRKVFNKFGVMKVIAFFRKYNKIDSLEDIVKLIPQIPNEIELEYARKAIRIFTLFEEQVVTRETPFEYEKRIKYRYHQLLHHNGRMKSIQTVRIHE